MAATEDDVRRRTLELRRRRLAIDAPQERGAFARFAAGTSRGTTELVGMPVDAVSGLMKLLGMSDPNTEPLGGSANIQRGLERMGMGVAPEEDLGMAGEAGRLTGQAVTGATAAVKAGMTSIANQGIQRTTGIVSNILQDTARTAIRNPITFFGVEAASGASAGAGRSYLSEKFPDSEAAAAFGEVLGGLAPSAALVGVPMAARGTGWLAMQTPLIGPRLIAAVRNNFRNYFTVSGAQRRATGRVSRATQDREGAMESLDRTDLIEGAPVTPAMKTEDPGLLALERAVMESSEDLSNIRRQNFTEINQSIRASLATTDGGAVVPIHQTKAYFANLLDERLRIAQAKADDRLQALGSTVTREDANRIAREELESALRAANAQENQLFKAIDEKAVVPTTATQEELSLARLTMGKAQQGDIPDIAKKFLLPGTKKKPNKNFFGDDTTVKEMRSLQVKLREEERIARAAGEYNKARIAGDLATAINDDLANAAGGPEVQEAVELAVSFARDKAKRFTQGEVGRLLGKTRVGGTAVDPSLTLETTVGKRGPRAKVATDALLMAVERNGDSAAMRGHIEAFLLDDFRRAAVAEGRIDPTAATNWLKSNQDVLSRFPELRRNIEQGKAASGQLVDIERQVNPEVSRAAVFVNAEPGREIERVISTGNPRQAMRDIVAVAQADSSGQAVRGLKQSFLNFIMRRSQLTAELDLTDVPIISGSRMESVITDPSVSEAMKGLFTKSEMERIARIQKTALLLERARKSGLPDEGIISDEPGMIASLVARIGGAQAGRMLASRTGGGTVQTPGILSAQLQQLLRAGVQDPARQLLSDSIQDPALFRALLIDPADSPKAEQAIRVTLNAWALDLLRQQNQSSLDDDE